MESGSSCPAYISVCSWNILSPSYAVKWSEPEGVDSDGKCNWKEVRWARIKEILLGNASSSSAAPRTQSTPVPNSPGPSLNSNQDPSQRTMEANSEISTNDNPLFDALLLEEVEQSYFDEYIIQAFAPFYFCHFQKHPQRKDGIAILLSKNTFGNCKIHYTAEHFHEAVTSLVARVDFPVNSGSITPKRLTFIATHQKGGRPAQWAHLMGLIFREQCLKPGEQCLQPDEQRLKTLETPSQSGRNANGGSPPHFPHTGTPCKDTVVITAGDFNEDFEQGVLDCKLTPIDTDMPQRCMSLEVEHRDPEVVPNVKFMWTLGQDNNLAPSWGSDAMNPEKNDAMNTDGNVAKSNAKAMNIDTAMNSDTNKPSGYGNGIKVEANPKGTNNTQFQMSNGAVVLPLKTLRRDGTIDKPGEHVPHWSRWKNDQTAVKIDWMFVSHGKDILCALEGQSSQQRCFREDFAINPALGQAVKEKMLQSYSLPRASDHAMEAFIVCL